MLNVDELTALSLYNSVKRNLIAEQYAEVERELGEAMGEFQEALERCQAVMEKAEQ